MKSLRDLIIPQSRHADIKVTYSDVKEYATFDTRKVTIIPKRGNLISFEAVGGLVNIINELIEKSKRNIKFFIYGRTIIQDVALKAFNSKGLQEYEDSYTSLGERVKTSAAIEMKDSIKAYDELDKAIKLIKSNRTDEKYFYFNQIAITFKDTTKADAPTTSAKVMTPTEMNALRKEQKKGKSKK